MSNAMEYMITEDQARSLLAANPPQTVAAMLHGLNEAENILLDSPTTRRGSLSAWKAFQIIAGRSLKGIVPKSVAKLSWVSSLIDLAFTIICLSVYYAIFQWVAGILTSVEQSGFSTYQLIVLLASACVLARIIGRIPSFVMPIVRGFKEEPITGYPISETEIQELLSSGNAPGYVVSIIDGLPVIERRDYKLTGKNLGTHLQVHGGSGAGSINLQDVSKFGYWPDKWSHMVHPLVLASIFWLGYETLMSEQHSSYESSMIVIFLADMVSTAFGYLWALRNARLAKQRPHLVW